jgi:peptide/nickel transport system permease protein
VAGPNGFSGLLQGDWGWSFEYDRPVTEVVGDALWLTLLVNVFVVIFVHLVSIPIAIYSATRQYSIGDYAVTLLGYIGLATPSFLLALILLYYVNRWFGVSIGGSTTRATPGSRGPGARSSRSSPTSSFRPSSSGSAARRR